MRTSLLILTFAIPSTACFSMAASVGGTIDATGQVDWVGQFALGLVVPGPSDDEFRRVVVDLRGYRLDGRAHVGAAIGGDLVSRPTDGRAGYHVGARVGGGGSLDLRDQRDNPLDLRAHLEAGVATGRVERDDTDAGVKAVAGLTVGPTVELAVHRKGRRAGSHLRLGARLVGELALWRPLD